MNSRAFLAALLLTMSGCSRSARVRDASARATRATERERTAETRSPAPATAAPAAHPAANDEEPAEQLIGIDRVTVSSEDCPNRQLHVGVLPQLFPTAGTPVFNGAVGARWAMITIDDGRVRGRIFDPSTRRLVPLASGGPRFRGRVDDVKRHGYPIAAGHYLLFPSTAGFAPAPALLDVPANRWIDISAGAPALDDPRELVLSEAWLAKVPREAGFHHPDRVAHVDLQTRSWTVMPAQGAPARRSQPALVACGSQLFIWGGHDDSGNPIRDGAVLDVQTKTWRSLPGADAPSARYNAFAGCVDGSVVVFGGNDVRDSGKWREAVPLWDGAAFETANARWRKLRPVAAPGPSSATWGGPSSARIEMGKLIVSTQGPGGATHAIVDPGTGTAWTLPPTRVSGASELSLGEAGLAWIGLEERAFIAPATPGGALARTPNAPKLAVLDVSSRRYCTWALPSIGPFAIPSGATPFRFGPTIPSRRALVVLGSVWSFPPENSCPPGAACLPSPPPRMDSNGTFALLQWD